MVDAALKTPSLAQESELPAKPPLAAACLIVVLLAAGLMVYLYQHNLPAKLDYKLIFAVVSIVVLLGMSGLYYHAYNFYRDSFYLFVALGWLSNAIYIVFEGFLSGVHGDPEYGLWLDLFMIATLMPFYVAGRLSKQRAITYKNLIPPGLIVLAWLFLKFLPGISAETRFGIATTAVAVLAFSSLRMVGQSASSRLRPSVHGRWARALVLTFYAYAYMQFVYLAAVMPPLKRVPAYAGWILGSAFVVALLLKIINSISAMNVIRHDFADLRVKYVHAQEQLTARSRFEEIGVLTASILHEILNPLGVIETRINLMKEKHQKEAEILKDLDEIDKLRAKVFTATRIIPYLRAEREFYESKMEKTNVGDLIRGSIKNLKGEVNTSEIDFRYENKDEAFFTLAYPQMMEEVFVNIFKNAIEAIRDARRKKGLVTIAMSIQSKSDQLMRVDISDNGRGIPPENIPLVTKALFSTRTGQKPNSGLGLFVTDRIVRIHDGKLEISSEIDVGTTVSLTLPLIEFHKKRSQPSVQASADFEED